MTHPILTLKPGREKSSATGHPWLFSGAFPYRIDKELHGHAVRIADADGAVVATGSASSKGNIAVRVFAQGEATLDTDFFAARMSEAKAVRDLAGLTLPGGGYRLIFGEADRLPGLIVDIFDAVAVIQTATAFMDRMRDTIVAALARTVAPTTVIEKSVSPSRREEGLQERIALLAGDDPGRVPFAENGMRFLADPLHGQKTGFFLDQRPLRDVVRRTAAGRSVLNLFSYSGAFGVAAMAGGATAVVNVDASADALDLAAATAAANDIDPTRFTGVEADAFSYLGENSDETYGMVVVDPPALVKSRKDVESGGKAYHFLNRAALRRVADGGIYVTSSCSQLMPRLDFVAMVGRAAAQAGVRLQYLAEASQPADHPLSPSFPEGGYLTGFVYRAIRERN